MANIIFQHTWELVVSGAKTQTRRLYSYRHSVSAHAEGTTITYHSAAGWEVGKTYAVMPARGVRGLRKVADIEITRIRREDIREISEADAEAEGFGYSVNFWHTWVDMHDQSFYETFAYAADMDYLREYGFYDRPLSRYDAWVLDFRVVNVYADAVAKARELLKEAA